MPHQQPAIVLQRVTNLIGRLRLLAVDAHATVPLQAVVGRSTVAVPWVERERLAFTPITIGESWGTTWDSAWFHVTATIPDGWRGAHVVARIDLAGEVLVCSADGEPLVGLCQGSVFDLDHAKDLYHLTPEATGGEPVDLWLEAAANDLLGVARTDPEQPHTFDTLHGVHRGTVRHLHLARLDTARYHLLHDLEVLLDLVQALPDGSPRRAKLLVGLDRAVSAFDRAGAGAGREALKPLQEVPADPAAIRFTGVGHAHIDTAWLWPVAETRRKVGRTFASQIDLIRRYPGYVFGASQAQLYAFVKEDYPGLYAQVQAAVAAGQWEVQGAMWVEADCNLPNGESLVRQVVLGKRWFHREFGVELRNLWLPDVFGYSGQLPQILRKAGVPYFLTQKLSWNRVNTFPHNTFVWKGLDGSEVLAHFPPENDYNARCRPRALIKAQERHQERGLIDEAVSLFGVGDGGGGPKEEFLERALRMGNLNGCPPYRFGAAQPVLERMDAHRADYGVWQGELYFECHRGTFTTQAGIKRSNRRAEEALALAELAQAAWHRAGYPAGELERLWKTLLTNQFHDIIPGSSIHRVYEEAVPQNEAVAQRATDLAREAIAGVGQADPRRATYVNPSSTHFDDLVPLPEGWTAAVVDGLPLVAQTDGDRVLARVQIPGHRSVVVQQREGSAAPSVATDGLVLANEVVTYRFAEDGRLVSAVLQADGRELLAGPANDLVLFEDRPHSWDAWDIDEQVLQAPRGRLVVTSLGQRRGPAFTELVLTGTVGDSAVRQTIRLRPGSARLDFITDVDWRERHKLLRVHFPTALVADGFTGEVQYGHVVRPTHRNTTWDVARFEVCCHRWADLSERTRGVALLNDAKYGYDCRGGILGLSLLRAPTDPDPIADRGHHRFTYAFLPHRGDLFDAPEVRAEAAMLNAGVLTVPGLAAPDLALPVQVVGEGLELAVLKAAEEGPGLIVRVVEVRGARARGRLVAPGRRLVPTDLLEWQDRPAEGAEGALDLDLGAFAIETFRVL